MNLSWEQAAKVLKKGGVVILPTDTLYGIVGSAYSQKTVERIYDIKNREKGKPCIVLITTYEDLKSFGADAELKKDKSKKLFLESIWPGKVSVVLHCTNNKMRYIHRATKSIAFRMVSPRNKQLFNLITKVGPLLAPSANPAGLIPAYTVKQAKTYFQDRVDGYVTKTITNKKPSTLVSLLGSRPKILRQGSVNIYKEKRSAR